MPTPTKYTYSKSVDFASGFNVDRLIDDINHSAIVTALDPRMVEVFNDVVDIWFKDELPGADKLLLDGSSLQPINSPPSNGSVLGEHTGVALPTSPRQVVLGHRTTHDNRILMAYSKPSGVRIIAISHDWTKPETWFQNATRVVDEVTTVLTIENTPPGSPIEGTCCLVGSSPTGSFVGHEGEIAYYTVKPWSSAWEFSEPPSHWVSGANKAYKLAHRWVIDITHSKLTDEDFLVDAFNNTYRNTVKVNDVVQVEDDPHYLDVSNNSVLEDYTIDPRYGIVFLHNATTDSVKVTYHYANKTASGSIYQLKAPGPVTLYGIPGKIYRIGSVETQFSDPIRMWDSVVFQTRCRAGNMPEIAALLRVFIPPVVGMTIGQASALLKVYPWGNLSTVIGADDIIPFGQKTYKNLKDFQDEATKSYPQYKAMGGDSWRAVKVPTQPFHWEYTNEIILDSRYNMDIIAFLHHGEPFDGGFATATFYGYEENVPA